MSADYDKIDCVISGELSVAFSGQSAAARTSEMIPIPNGSAIRFRNSEFARFLYVTYPADLQNAG